MCCDRSQNPGIRAAEAEGGEGQASRMGVHFTASGNLPGLVLRGYLVCR